MSATFWLKVESRMVLIVPLVVYSSSSSALVKVLPFLRTASSSARRMLANVDECWMCSYVAWMSQDTLAISVLSTQMCQEWFAGSSVVG